MSGKLPVGLAETGSPAATKTSNIAKSTRFWELCQATPTLPTCQQTSWHFVALSKPYFSKEGPNLQPQLRAATSQVVASPSVACRASHLGLSPWQGHGNRGNRGSRGPNPSWVCSPISRHTERHPAETCDLSWNTGEVKHGGAKMRWNERNAIPLLLQPTGPTGQQQHPAPIAKSPIVPCWIPTFPSFIPLVSLAKSPCSLLNPHVPAYINPRFCVEIPQKNECPKVDQPWLRAAARAEGVASSGGRLKSLLLR